MLSEAELSTRIDALLRADDFGLPSWTSSAGSTESFTYRFQTTQPTNFLWSYDGPGGFSSFTAAQESAIRSVLAEYSHYINIDFVEDNTAIAETIDLGFFRANDLYTEQATNGGGGRGRWSYQWDGSEYDWTGMTAFRDIRPIENQSYYDLILHEIGHTLGLKHPGDYDVGGNNPEGPFLPVNEDNDRYTIMSYNVNPVTNTESHHLMLYDIAALQQFWGANMSANAGQNTYSGPDDGRVQVIWDAGGVDSFDHLSATNSIIDLR